MQSDLQVFKAEFFRALAHPVRIRILEALAGGERTVRELQQTLGLEQPLVSQQLAVLRNKNVVSSRKVGTTVRYALGDPRITRLLRTAREIFNHQLTGTQTMLKALQKERRREWSDRELARAPRAPRRPDGKARRASMSGT